MPILSGATADAELSLVTAIEDFDTGPGGYPYTRLSAEDFERLSYALFKMSQPPGQDRVWDDAAIMVRGADAGRDILLSIDARASGIVQCKRLEIAISLPAVFKEFAKLILFAEADLALPKVTPGLSYFLALAHDPAGTVVDFFVRPTELLKTRRSDLQTAVRDVLESYVTLTGLDESEAQAKVWEILPTLKLKLVRPADLDGWMAKETSVAARFFRHRILVDNAEVTAQNAAILAGMEQLRRQVEGVPLLTDVDLKIIKERIEGTPETHRVAVGFASFFGFPREMFVGDANLKRRIGRLAELLNELNGDYTDWMFTRANEEAMRICDLGEVVYTVHPFARQIPADYLGLVASDILGRAISGDVMSRILANVTKQQIIENDDDRLAHVRSKLLEQGRRYLKGDLSQVVGEGELREMKLKLIEFMMKGVNDEATLDLIIEKGESVLRPHLDNAAASLRLLGAQRPSVFLMGTPGLDNPEVISRMAATVQALDAMCSKSRD
jgi:hypothetical protein